MVGWKTYRRRLNHKGLQEITIKYHSDHLKHRYEVVDELKTMQ